MNGIGEKFGKTIKAGTLGLSLAIGSVSTTVADEARSIVSYDLTNTNGSCRGEVEYSDGKKETLVGRKCHNIKWIKSYLIKNEN